MKKKVKDMTFEEIFEHCCETQCDECPLRACFGRSCIVFRFEELFEKEIEVEIDETN